MEKEGERIVRTWWNYRRAKRKFPDSDDEAYFIVEAYYTDGILTGITAEEMAPWGESEDELQMSYKMMREAFDKPVIDYDTREEIK